MRRRKEENGPKDKEIKTENQKTRAGKVELW